MAGFGGTSGEYSELAETARQNPQWQWWVLGPVPELLNSPDNLRFVGVVDNPGHFLKGADVVVASAGNNTVMELAQLKARYICIPEARPFDEQLSKARILAHKNAALVLPRWPEPADWQHHLSQVFGTDPEALHSVIVEDAAQRAAEHIEEVARQYSTDPVKMLHH
jgi:predicted glycosyltransferase